MKQKISFAVILVCILLFAAGCQSAAEVTNVPTMDVVLELVATPAPTLKPTPTPAPTPLLTPTPAPTPEPTPVYAHIGAVGDVMVMQTQVTNAWYEDRKEYDFLPSFTYMQPLFESVDLMCANLETPLAGEEAGYSGPMPTVPPTVEGEEPASKPRQTFNAPDELASSLQAAGVDVLTTANNHCLDRGADGLIRTMETLDALGVMRAGTYLSPEDRATARVAEVNGIRVGIIAHTFSVNRNERLMSSEQRTYMVARLNDEDAVLEDIALCKAAGAEFIIAFMHWDEEFQAEPTRATRQTAKWLLENGVDAIIGSHPHVPQPVEYVTVEREEGSYTGLVAYSVANFISNMSPAPKTYGVYVQMTLEKDVDGTVQLCDAAYLPLLCKREKQDGRTLHRVYPAYEDTSLITERASLIEELAQARAYVTQVCGTQIRTLEDGG